MSILQVGLTIGAMILIAFLALCVERRHLRCAALKVCPVVGVSRSGTHWEAYNAPVLDEDERPLVWEGDQA